MSASSRLSSCCHWIRRFPLKICLPVLLLFLGCAISELFFFFPGLELLATMGLGWKSFLARVLPQVNLNREILLVAVVMLIGCSIGFHRMLRWWRRWQAGDAAKWRLGWTLQIELLILLLFAASIAATGIVHQAGWLAREPRIVIDASRGIQTRQLSILKQIGLGLALHRGDENAFPEALSELIPDYLPSGRILLFPPEEGEPPELALYYLPRRGAEPRPQDILLASPAARTTRSGHVWRAIARADGSAEFIEDAEFQRLVRDQQTRREPVSGPGKNH